MSKAGNFISISIGIIGILIGVYFHYTSKEKKEISYFLNPTTYKVYDSNITDGLQKISLYKDDSIKITNNVYLLTFSIWNSGNMPIDTVGIRKELCITFNGIDNILELRKVKEYTPEISRFELIQTTPTSFNLKWKYFDPNDGLKFQLLYTGNEKPNVKLDGKILKTQFLEYKFLKSKSLTEIMLIIGTAIVIFLIVFSIGIFKGSLLFSFFNRKIRFHFTSSNQSRLLTTLKKVLVIILLISYLIIVPMLWYRYFFEYTNPPF